MIFRAKDLPDLARRPLVVRQRFLLEFQTSWQELLSFFNGQKRGHEWEPFGWVRYAVPGSAPKRKRIAEPRLDAAAHFPSFQTCEPLLKRCPGTVMGSYFTDHAAES